MQRARAAQGKVRLKVKFFVVGKNTGIQPAVKISYLSVAGR